MKKVKQLFADATASAYIEAIGLTEERANELYEQCAQSYKRFLVSIGIMIYTTPSFANTSVESLKKLSAENQQQIKEFVLTLTHPSNFFALAFCEVQYETERELIFIMFQAYEMFRKIIKDMPVEIGDHLLVLSKRMMQAGLLDKNLTIEAY